MTLNDPIGDMFTRIRNGQLRLLTKVEMPSSNFRLKVLDVLKNEGFISSYDVVTEKDSSFEALKVNLKYVHGTPVIREIKRISKPSLRRYSAATELKEVRNGLGIYVLSTSKGLMSDKDAKSQNIGGEVICEVF